MSRKTARDFAFKYIYEYSISGITRGISYEKYSLVKDMTADDVAYFRAVADGAVAKYEELSQIVADNAEGYVLERVYKIDLAILILALYEIKYCDEIPVSVSINEAVELAKTYSTDKSPAFINGILAKIVA